MSWVTIPEAFYSETRTILQLNFEMENYRSTTVAFKSTTSQDPAYQSSKFLKPAEVSGRSARNSQ